MEPKAQLTSCIPCSRRKVRCDRQQPCVHCKRRKGDICEYPGYISSRAKSYPDTASTRSQQDRIEQLESYVRQIGGDVSEAGRVLPACATDRLPTNGRKRQRTLEEPNGSSEQPVAVGSLVEHDDETTYVEAPTWFGWDEARSPEQSSRHPSQRDKGADVKGKVASSGYSLSILELKTPEQAFYCDVPFHLAVSIWAKYLTNVHPIVKIFFDWDKEHIMHQAADNPASLNRRQRAFVSAVFLITALSMSVEECKATFGFPSQDESLNAFQSAVEDALLAAEYASMPDLLVLQALLLYMLAIRNRVRPSTNFSLMGIAVRLAQLLGLHRDGSHLKLSPMRAEERRRIWWQMQHIEILAAQLLGCISMTLFANWDTKLPSNLEDGDLSTGTKELPPNRPELTSMSHCLWRYEVLDMQRQQMGSKQGTSWFSSERTRSSDGKSMVRNGRKMFSEKYLQHCELVNPLHVQIQVGIQNTLLAAERATLQPGPTATRLSDMPQQARNDLLNVCTKSMEYYIITETNPSISHFRWHNESYFQWTAFVYILVEAQRRAATAEAPGLWSLIDRVCKLHPKLTTATDRSQISAIGHILLLAWKERQEYNLHRQAQEDTPWCVEVFETALGLRGGVPDGVVHDESAKLDLDDSFNFDLIDWSCWESGNFLFSEDFKMP